MPTLAKGHAGIIEFNLAGCEIQTQYYIQYRILLQERDKGCVILGSYYMIVPGGYNTKNNNL